MPTEKPSVAGHGSGCKGDNTEQENWRDWAPTSAFLRGRAKAQFCALLAMTEQRGVGSASYEAFEARLIPEVL